MPMMKKNQNGYTLLEMMMVVGLVTFMTILSMQRDAFDLEVTKAKAVGSELLQFNNAVRSWLSNNVGASPAVYNGTAWLKHTSCTGGLSGIGYLPCNFPDYSSANPSKFGNLSITSSITTTGTSPNQITTVTSSTSPFRLDAGEPRSDLSGVAAIVAASGRTIDGTPALMTTEGSFAANPLTAIITMRSRNNGSTDAWLRTDGSNTMNSNITFKSSNGSNLREVKNVSRLSNILLQQLHLGNAGGEMRGVAESVVVDADQQIMGKMTISNNAGSATALSISSGDIAVNSGSISASGNITANGRVVANSQIRAPVFYDSDNAAYYVDPGSLSVFKDIKTTGRVTVGEFIQFDSSVPLGGSCATNGTLSRISDGSAVSCVSGKWEKLNSPPSGTICGHAAYYGGTPFWTLSLCDGHNPRTSCPPGFSGGYFLEGNSGGLVTHSYCRKN